MKTSERKHLKVLRLENSRLKGMHAKLLMDNQITKPVIGEKLKFSAIRNFTVESKQT
jgi:hypothetical protein